MVADLTAERKSHRLLGNSAWNVAAFLISVGLNLVVLPFVAFRLGLAAFGVAGLVTACVAPALAFSNALAMATTRELAQRLSPSEREASRRFFGTALLLAGGIGLMIAMILSLGGPPAARLAFSLQGSAADDLSLTFLLGASGWLCQSLSAVFLALFTSRQDYRRIALVSIVSALVSTGSMVVLVPRWPQASTFIGCQALGFATSLLSAMLLSRLVVGEWPARPALHRVPLGDLIHLGGWQFAAQMSGLVAGQADRYLLGAFLQPQFVGLYTITQRLEEAMYIGILKVGEILFPFFSALQNESSERIADLLFRSSWVLNVLAATALGALIPVAGPLLQFWAGREVGDQAQQLLVVLAVAGMLGCSANVFAFYLVACGRSRSSAVISLVTAVLTLATSAVALPHFGWRAAGWSSCVGMIAQIIVTMILLRQSFRLAGMWSRLAHFVLLPLGAGIMVALGMRYSAAGFLSEVAPHWWYVGGAYALAAGVILVVVVAVSGVGPHGPVCWRDLRFIATRFLKAI
ncbi:lipopolysaccharide biosynthesis protein [Bradyrhizobium sp. DASA03120]|uniref:lipopolysaccharide biosynthesis protein n=1 Tax=Bradyrhizobium sp. SMVTL-02 TaxID=3395917 RepID=UPI003F6E9067